MSAEAAIYNQFVSDEPLHIIRVNECESDLTSLSTKRFRTLWNEIERLRAERDAAARDMRERCKAVATERLASLEKLRDDLHTLEAKGNVQDSMDQVLIVLGAIAALPDALFATSRKDAT